jgi:hypothetical protein
MSLLLYKKKEIDMKITKLIWKLIIILFHDGNLKATILGDEGDSWSLDRIVVNYDTQKYVSLE